MTNDILEDVAEIIMGQSPASTTCNIDGVGIPLLNGPTEFGSHHPLAVQFTTDAKKIAKPGDILFCVRGSTTGRMNWSDQIYAIGRGIGAIRHKQGIEYQPLVRGVIECELSDLLTQATGSTFPNVSASQLSKIRWPALDDAEQRRIAHILGTLDDKIENNRKTAKTLEAMAQAIFQSWFVDFDPVRAKVAGESKESICKRLKLTPEILDLFPDRLVDSEFGEIPDGWVVKPIIDEFDITMGQSPPGNTYNQLGDGLPFYQGCTDFGVKYPSKRVFCTKPTRTAHKGDSLISVRAPVGRTNVATETCAIGRGVAAIQHHTKSTTYTYNVIVSLHDIFDGFNFEGTVFGAIGKSDFHKIKMISPPDLIVREYASICNVVDQRQAIFHEETNRLEKARDTLLPKLISGEIRVLDEHIIENDEAYL